MFLGRFSILSFALLLSFSALADSQTGGLVLFSAAEVCELTMHSPEEIALSLAQSYRGLLEFGGEEFTHARLQSFLIESTSLEKFFEPVPGRVQRSVALNESLTRLGDWVMLESEDHGLTHEQIAARLREVVRAHLGQTQEEQERTEETREDRVDPGHVTTTGAVFFHDYRFPQLGEAWRDPDGMVWGDVVRDENGDPLKMTHEEALMYCRQIEADLPSREDFARLREYMGAALGIRSERDAPGYSPQVLPGLRRGLFWASSFQTVHNGYIFSYKFDGDYGHIGDAAIGPNGFRLSVRCVRR